MCGEAKTVEGLGSGLRFLEDLLRTPGTVASREDAWRIAMEAAALAIERGALVGSTSGEPPNKYPERVLWRLEVSHPEPGLRLDNLPEGTWEDVLKPPSSGEGGSFLGQMLSRDPRRCTVEVEQSVRLELVASPALLPQGGEDALGRFLRAAEARIADFTGVHGEGTERAGQAFASRDELLLWVRKEVETRLEPLGVPGENLRVFFLLPGPGPKQFRYAFDPEISARVRAELERSLGLVRGYRAFFEMTEYGFSIDEGAGLVSRAVTARSVQLTRDWKHGLEQPMRDYESRSIVPFPALVHVPLLERDAAIAVLAVNGQPQYLTRPEAVAAITEVARRATPLLRVVPRLTEREQLATLGWFLGHTVTKTHLVPLRRIHRAIEDTSGEAARETRKRLQRLTGLAAVQLRRLENLFAELEIFTPGARGEEARRPGTCPLGPLLEKVEQVGSFQAESLNRIFFGGRQRLRLEVTRAPGLECEISGGEETLLTLIFNLLDNAMRAAGQVEGSGEDTERVVRVSVDREGDEVVVAVVNPAPPEIPVPALRPDQATNVPVDEWCKMVNREIQDVLAGAELATRVINRRSLCGMGLYTSARIVRRLGGRLEIVAGPEGGGPTVMARVFLHTGGAHGQQ